jgi:hypothetical protein
MTIFPQNTTRQSLSIKPVRPVPGINLDQQILLQFPRANSGMRFKVLTVKTLRYDAVDSLTANDLTTECHIPENRNLKFYDCTFN